MREIRILVVDDEKNVRRTLQRALDAEGYEVDAAVNGEEGLKKVNDGNYELVLLDMKLPGMDGMEVLRRLSGRGMNVVMITGYGTVETAVEAMKLGAIDFLQKPFSPQEIRDMVADVLQREELETTSPEEADFATCLNLAKKMINDKKFDTAREYLEQAISRDPSTPEPFNLLGVILEMKNEHLEALKNYRAALALDPTYRPAKENLERATQFDYTLKGMSLGEEEEDGGEK